MDRHRRAVDPRHEQVRRIGQPQDQLLRHHGPHPGRQDAAVTCHDRADPDRLSLAQDPEHGVEGAPVVTCLPSGHQPLPAVDQDDQIGQRRSAGAWRCAVAAQPEGSTALLGQRPVAVLCHELLAPHGLLQQAGDETVATRRLVAGDDRAGVREPAECEQAAGGAVERVEVDVVGGQACGDGAGERAQEGGPPRAAGPGHGQVAVVLHIPGDRPLGLLAGQVGEGVGHVPRIGQECVGWHEVWQWREPRGRGASDARDAGGAGGRLDDWARSVGPQAASRVGRRGGGSPAVSHDQRDALTSEISCS